MSCYNPLLAVPPHPNSLDRRYKILGSWRRLSSEFLPTVVEAGEVLMPVQIPCGHCVGCKLDYSKMWANRIVLESMNYDNNFFLTLTYDDSHLPTVKGIPSLRFDDFSEFVKRLRSYYKRNFDVDGIRFFAASEYGSMSFRPHYHACFFNLCILDLEYYSTTSLGDILYTSPTLERLWSHGFVVIGELTYESAAYTARYCVKKVVDRCDDFLPIESERVRMSRRPGIASDYFIDKGIEIYENDGKIYLPDGKLGTIPRYYQNKLKEIDERVVSVYKSKKEQCQLDRLDWLSRSAGMPLKAYNANLEDSMLKRIKSLERSF